MNNFEAYLNIIGGTLIGLIIYIFIYNIINHIKNRRMVKNRLKEICSYDAIYIQKMIKKGE